MRDWPKVDYCIASHVLTDGPAQALRDWLALRGRRVAFLSCPMEDAAQARAEVACYIGGEQVFSAQGHGRRIKGVGLWIRDWLFVRAWAKRLCHPKTVFIGVNNLNVLAAVGLRRHGGCARLIYYVIDYSHRRFQNRVLNAVYQWVARRAARQADEIWNLSERMKSVHVDFGTAPEKNRIVPIGIDRGQIASVSDEAVDSNRWIVVSTLYASKGVQLAIDALAQVPQARLVIVGQGPYEKELREQAASLGVSDRVTFFGGASRRELFEQIAHSRVALATYENDADNYTHYADPAKPKEYLACGVPVVITRVPWIADVIDQTPMGQAVDNDAAQVAKACRRLMEDQAFWQTCRENARLFSKDADWNMVFTQAFAGHSDSTEA